MGNRTSALLLFAVLLFWADAALALRVLVVRPTPSDAPLYEAFGRLRAELKLNGFEVTTIAATDRPVDTDQLEVEAQAQDAFAAVALQRDAGSTIASIYIVDRVTGKTVRRKLKISSAEDGPTLLAIRAADLLRASLLELKPGEQPPADVVGVEQEPISQEVAEFASDPPSFQVAVGGALVAHSDLGTALGGSIGVLGHPLPRLAIGIKFIGPAIGGEYEANQGSAKLRQELVFARGALNLGQSRLGSRLEWGPALGIGVGHVEATGNVQPPLTAQTRDLWALALYGGLGVEAYLGSTLSIALEAAALSLLPRPVVAVVEDRSAPLGVQGVASLSLGVSF